TARFHSSAEADQAASDFTTKFSNRQFPENTEISEVRPSISLIDFMVSAGAAVSRGDARRRMQQGGVRINGKKINFASIGESNVALQSLLDASGDNYLQVGKLFVRKLVTQRDHDNGDREQ